MPSLALIRLRKFRVSLLNDAAKVNNAAKEKMLNAADSI